MTMVELKNIPTTEHYTKRMELVELNISNSS